APVHGQLAGLGVRHDVVLHTGDDADRAGRLQRADALLVEDGPGAGLVGDDPGDGGTAAGPLGALGESVPQDRVPDAGGGDVVEGGPPLGVDVLVDDLLQVGLGLGETVDGPAQRGGQRTAVDTLHDGREVGRRGTAVGAHERD